MALSKYEQDMLGAELPEQEIVEGQPQEAAKPEPASDPEPTPVEETPVEPEVDPLTKVFREEGLDRQFKSPEEVLRKQRENNRYITQVEQDRATVRRENEELRRQLQSVQTPKPAPEPQAPLTGEELYNDPNTAIERLGVAKRGDLDPIQQRLDQIELRQINDEAVSVLNGIDDLKDVAVQWKNGTSGTYSENQIFNRMKEIFQANPGFWNQAPSQALPLLYNAVLGERSKLVAPTTTTVDPKKKEAATTASGKPTKIAGQKDASYYSKLSLAELEKDIGYVEPS